MHDRLALLIKLLLVWLVSAASVHRCLADDKTSTETARGYASPGAAFDAYRDACQKQDRRALYYCTSTQYRDYMVVGTFEVCLFRNDPRLAKIMKAFGVEGEVVNAEYCKRYQQKHGIDIPNRTSDGTLTLRVALDEEVPVSGTAPMPIRLGYVPRVPPLDVELLHEALFAKLVDKAGFFAETDQILSDKLSMDTIREPENLVIQVDKATFTININRHYITFSPERTATKVPFKDVVTVYFSRSNAGWLIDGVGVPPRELASRIRGKPGSRVVPKQDDETPLGQESSSKRDK